MFRVVRQFVQRDWAKVPSRIHHFITISDLNRRINAPYMPADSKFYHLDNPFDIERTEPAQPALNQTVVFVGRLVPEKAPHHLAMATAKLSMPVTFCRRWSIGRRDSSFDPAAKITGWLSAEQVTQELRNARVLVLPSVWYEGNHYQHWKPQRKGFRSSFLVPVLLENKSQRESMDLSFLWKA